jgi:hypothetical protein
MRFGRGGFRPPVREVTLYIYRVRMRSAGGTMWRKWNVGSWESSFMVSSLKLCLLVLCGVFMLSSLNINLLLNMIPSVLMKHHEVLISQSSWPLYILWLWRNTLNANPFLDRLCHPNRWNKTRPCSLVAATYMKFSFWTSLTDGDM